jgi:subtilisin family serine protease
MGRGRRQCAWLAAAGLGAALLVAPGNAQAAQTPASTAQSAPGRAPAPVPAVDRSVTLITGDRVTVADGGQVSIERQPGRQKMRFVSYRDGGHLHVIPSDALPLLLAGRLDSRLFDVTALREFGYDDSRADLPLIVRYAGKAARASARATVSMATVTRELPVVDALAIRAAKPDTAKLWASLTEGDRATRTLSGGVAKVWLDGLRKPTLDVSVPQIGAPAAWQAGYDGTGVTVAVLDTGIDATHPDLAGRVVAERNFTDGVEDERDLVGHGTHVASTIAGGGEASQGRYKGVAPGARLLDGKVCVVYGCSDSWTLAGMEWAAAEQHAQIVNMSLGGQDFPGVDLLEEAVQRLTAQYGTLFVIAAGNVGGDQTVGSPASADAALAVGAVDGNDQLADFSSRGPRVGDGAIKPDITAPGVDITAARGKDALVGVPGEPYVTLSGTSMAAPHVAGAAALLAQRHPDWSPTLLKSTLMGSATPTPAVGVFGQGAGRVDVAAAITQTVTAAPASVSFGLQQWPHTDDQPVTKDVTYHNNGTADVTLNLAFQATGPDGAAAPAGMFTLDQQTLTVPAGTEATVTLTVDTRTTPVGRYGGYLTATAADSGHVVRTPFAVESESERYDLTLPLITRAGTPAVNYSVIVFRLDQFASYTPYDEDGTVNLRLPKGRYAVFSSIFEGEQWEISTLLAQPQLDLTGAQTVAMDAGLAKKVTVTVPDSSARGIWGEFTAHTQTANLSVPLEMNMGSFSGFDNAYLGQVGPRQVADDFVSKISGVLAQVKPDGSYNDSPYAYHLAWFQKGHMMTGLDRQFAAEDLAAVRQDYAQQVAGGSGVAATYATLPGLATYITTLPLKFTLPSIRTEYHNTNEGVLWNKVFQERLPSPFGLPRTQATTTDRAIAYEAGRSYDEQWNHAVFGPSLSDPADSSMWVSRDGDSIVASPPMFGDGAGRQGSSLTSSRHIALYRDGEMIAEAANLAGSFTVPAGDAEYRLQVDAQRGTPFLTSTRNSVVWTFRSGHVDGDQPVRLPLSAVHFAPQLDGQNRAPAGQVFSVPVNVTPQPGSAAGKITTLTVEASFDDGQTWQSAPLASGPTGWIAQISHPAGDGFVSLRAKAADEAGNTVEQTIIRAYPIAAGG